MGCCSSADDFINFPNNHVLRILSEDNKEPDYSELDNRRGERKGAARRSIISDNLEEDRERTSARRSLVADNLSSDNKNEKEDKHKEENKNKKKD